MNGFISKNSDEQVNYGEGLLALTLASFSIGPRNLYPLNESSRQLIFPLAFDGLIDGANYSDAALADLLEAIGNFGAS